MHAVTLVTYLSLCHYPMHAVSLVTYVSLCHHPMHAVSLVTRVIVSPSHACSVTSDIRVIVSPSHACSESTTVAGAVVSITVKDTHRPSVVSLAHQCDSGERTPRVLSLLPWVTCRTCLAGTKSHWLWKHYGSMPDRYIWGGRCWRRTVEGGVCVERCV